MQKLAGPKSRTKHWLVRYPRGMPVAIFLLVTAVTALSVFAIERGEDQRTEAQLRAQANAISSALEQRANASSAYLRAGAALLAMLDEVPASQFRRFVSELRLDADYRGEVGVILINHGSEAFTVTRGMRIAQMVIARHAQARWHQVESLDETARGAGGFGSTGTAVKGG